MSIEVSHKTSDVFGITRAIPLNYVVRKEIDGSLIDNLTRDKHIVIYGSSKQGKTSLRKHCLKESDYIVVHCLNRWSLSELHSAILKAAGYEITLSQTMSTSGNKKIIAKLEAGVFGIGAKAEGELEASDEESTTFKPLELDSADVNDIIKALQNFHKYIVLEDFHYLPIETQKDFSVALKAFHEQSDLCFIIVGVWLEASRLTVYNGDLTGRVIGINADKWLPNELIAVIEAGEALLNIHFADSFKTDLLANCADSVYIVQEACYRACKEKDIHTTQSKTLEVGAGIDVPKLIQTVVDQQTGRYNSFIAQFSSGFQETALQMYKWLLYPIITSQVQSLESGLSFREIKDSLRSHHPEKANLNVGNITQALQSSASLQVHKDIKPIVLDYDQTNLMLNVVDRSFIIWLRYQDKNNLLSLAGLPVS